MEAEEVYNNYTLKLECENTDDGMSGAIFCFVFLSHSYIPITEDFSWNNSVAYSNKKIYVLFM